MRCKNLFEILVIWIRTTVRSIRRVAGLIRELLNWAQSIVQAAKNICGSLPWPFDKLCELFMWLLEKAIEGLMWLYENVIDGVFKAVEAVLEYVYWLLGWIFWAVGWILRSIDLAACMAFPKSTRYLHICARILQDENGNLAVPTARVKLWLEGAKAFFEDHCHILLTYDIQIVAVKDTLFQKDFDCKFVSIFSNPWRWFSEHAVPCCVTMYVVRNVLPDAGCTIPGTNWFVMDGGLQDDKKSARCIVHEFGHLSDLWAHSSTPGNLMHTSCGSNVDPIQCCMMRTSRFVTTTP